ncbi:MAG: response regulator [Gloeotrichia echinulata GP01]
MTNLILVVDDDYMTRIQLCDLLEQAGYQVAEASNGSEALDIYSEIKPNLVLLDAMMPIMDGFTCCVQLQTVSGSENTPVLMITGLYDQASVERAFAVGATDLITKPIYWPLLRERVSRMLQASRAVKELRQQTQQAQMQETQLRLALEASQMGVWNWDITNNKVTWSKVYYTIMPIDSWKFSLIDSSKILTYSNF